MIFMGNSVRAVVVWGVVSIVILLITYFVIVKPIIDDSNEQVDRALDTSERIQENAADEVDEALEQSQQIQESAQGEVDEAIEQSQGGKGQGGTAAPSAEEIQEQIDEQLEAAGVETTP